jgi:hypothetical protein
LAVGADPVTNEAARLQEAEHEVTVLAVNPDKQAKPAMRSTANPPPIGYVDQD